ncbi:RdgB/HAM1 family non-canonical purine NTP pyrophosphatase [Fulvivirga sedimenti]|uniref:dITP/XTP pyrophosphatase n=1 Tax=Fulvivirga sedimenti TaxID=2879465 RepID=A0A9X1L2F6_9BACT|nr:RdgB/HAM1 family non-canonical purine NTP pyrophosphatase [Fulvivirga sedimenti]MCA6078136.1 RdgB/HAM1 family non-canonical purine NTP pyrophosphatase [Fulvivirga sedimenti]
MDICFATNNKHKVEEVASLLPPSFRLLTLKEIGCMDELPEERDTLEGNSLQKAEYVFNKFGIPCISDDTGLEVNALNGRPGVYSARYAGPDADSPSNIQKLLQALGDTENRAARFRTIITFITPDVVRQFEGTVEGCITHSLSGLSGFGYDPVFMPEGHDVTFAEMTSDEKNAISHRGRAVRKLVDYLKSQENSLISS